MSRRDDSRKSAVKKKRQSNFGRREEEDDQQQKQQQIKRESKREKGGTLAREKTYRERAWNDPVVLLGCFFFGQEVSKNISFIVPSSAASPARLCARG